MGRVLVTGSNGVLGTVLKAGLPHDITDFDLPHQSAQDYAQLYEHAKGHDTLVHLAWDFDGDGWLADNLNPANAQMSYNVFQAAVDAGVTRVIVASSVHADKFAGRDTATQGLLKPFDLPLPDSPYGAGKCMLEALGRYYADAKGLEVICIRFGGVNKTDEPPASPYSERQVWFSHRDCVNLLTACIEADSVPYNYTIIHGVSANKDKLHDTVNPFGWQPLDGAT
jgi:nucleoside-diphosphate-sugar epimerase